MSQGTIQIDVKKFVAMKRALEQLGDQRKTIKGQADEIENQAVQALLQMNKRFIDESGDGSGPFWVLGKAKNDGSWNHDRYVEFFSTLYSEISNGKRFTPEQTSTLAQNYLKQYEKRRLVLNRLNSCRQRTCEDLKQWLEEKTG